MSTRAEQPTLLVTFSMRLYCPRCNTPQQCQLHWWGDALSAHATMSSVAHDCLAPPHPDSPGGVPVDGTVPLW